MWKARLLNLTVMSLAVTQPSLWTANDAIRERIRFNSEIWDSFKNQ
jgi:hypothetical protein